MIRAETRVIRRPSATCPRLFTEHVRCTAPVERLLGRFGYRRCLRRTVRFGRRCIVAKSFHVRVNRHSVVRFVADALLAPYRAPRVYRSTVELPKNIRRTRNFPSHPPPAGKKLFPFVLATRKIHSAFPIGTLSKRFMARKQHDYKSPIPISRPQLPVQTAPCILRIYIRILELRKGNGIRKT